MPSCGCAKMRGPHRLEFASLPSLNMYPRAVTGSNSVIIACLFSLCVILSLQPNSMSALCLFTCYSCTAMHENFHVLFYVRPFTAGSQSLDFLNHCFCTFALTLSSFLYICAKRVRNLDATRSNATSHTRSSVGEQFKLSTHAPQVARCRLTWCNA